MNTRHVSPSCSARRSSIVLLIPLLAAPVHGQATTRVSVDSAGAQGNGVSGNNQLAISADGRYVAFMSDASNLVTGDTNFMQDVFVRDLQLDTTQRVTVSSLGAQGNLSSGNPSISAGGRYVTFDSQATNLVGGDTNGMWD